MEQMEKLYQRFQEAKGFKDNWLALYKELYLYVIPDRDAFNVKFNYNDSGKPTTVLTRFSSPFAASHARPTILLD